MEMETQQKIQSKFQESVIETLWDLVNAKEFSKRKLVHNLDLDLIDIEWMQIKFSFFNDLNISEDIYKIINFYLKSIFNKIVQQNPNIFDENFQKNIFILSYQKFIRQITNTSLLWGYKFFKKREDVDGTFLFYKEITDSFNVSELESFELWSQNEEMFQNIALHFKEIMEEFNELKYELKNIFDNFYYLHKQIFNDEIFKYGIYRKFDIIFTNYPDNEKNIHKIKRWYSRGIEIDGINEKRNKIIYFQEKYDDLEKCWEKIFLNLQSIYFSINNISLIEYKKYDEKYQIKQDKNIFIQNFTPWIEFYKKHPDIYFEDKIDDEELVIELMNLCE